MSDIKQTTRTIWFPILFFSLLTAVAFSVFIYAGVAELVNELGPLLQADTGQTPSAAWDLVRLYHPRFWYTLFPAMMGLALLMGLFAWLSVRSMIRRRLDDGPERKTAPDQPAAKDDKAQEELAARRMFLHLFAMLQREGRLMDFLAEDLDQYEDSQIGSAVRAVHAGCLRTVNEYLDPRPVLDEVEGEDVVIDADFDPGAVKLTGRVVGEPPFKGVLRHRGWQVGNLKLPTLTGRQNAEIIIPAEVEL